MKCVVSNHLKAVGLHTLRQATAIHRVAGSWTAERGSHGNVATKSFIGNKSRNKEAEAARKIFELGDKENMLVNVGSHGNVPAKAFIGNKSRNKEVEAARNRFELGDVINMLDDIGSHGNVATKTLTGNMLRNKEVEAPRRRFGLSDKTNMLVDIGSHGDVRTKTFIGNKSRNKEAEAPRKRFGLGAKTNMLVDIDSQGNAATKTFIGIKSRNKEVKAPRKIFGLTDRTNMLVDIVIKWILSKGQAMTMDTYEQLLCALDKDCRAEEAHAFWDKRIGSNLRSVPWQMCASMIYIYQRNNMPEKLIKLFNDLEMHNWKPPDKAVIKKVADTYELIGLQEEQERVLKKYESLFTASSKNGSKKKKGKRS